MAALPVGALPLTVPGPTPKTLSSLFADASKDPTGRNWDTLMTSFLHDAHNTNKNTDTNALREMVTESDTRNELLS